MATLRNKRKLAAVTKETQEEHPRNGQSRNTSVPRINEEYITQVPEEIEGRVTKKLSQEFSRTESRILDALSKLDEVLLNQQIQTHSRTVSGTFRIYTARPCIISHKRFPNSGEDVFVRKEILSSPIHFSCDAVSRSLGFVLKVLGVIEAQYLFATSFIFAELFRSGSGF